MSPARALPLLVALLLGVGASLLVACGSGTKGGIPVASADQLDSELDAVSQAVADGRCDTARAEVVKLRGEILNLPASTSQALVNRLKQGVDNLEQRVTQDCTPKTTSQSTTTPTDTTPTDTTPTDTTPTDTTPTDTTPTDTTPTDTTPTDTTPTDTTPTDTTGTGTSTSTSTGTGGTTP